MNALLIEEHLLLQLGLRQMLEDMLASRTVKSAGALTMQCTWRWTPGVQMKCGGSACRNPHPASARGGWLELARCLQRRNSRAAGKRLGEQVPLLYVAPTEGYM
ncbi:hypothetical protein [Cupriavidus sp. D39]|uniref:hypothetical protein n=1 Tax=Cupriavidus sp. D39 TaxID=2997877 RepID=UPI00226E04B0|nr:hypothetical protein [Cupriavidus sp. D39]MCY0853358.1 hypothetical protein [Cupriavidus sp. D39]